MFRFSCFSPYVPSHKHKKTVLSGEAMGKDLVESSLNKTGKSRADHSRVKRECKSHELGGNYIGSFGVMLHKDESIRKSLSLGNMLNWEERCIADRPEDDMENRLLHNLSKNCSGNAAADDVDARFFIPTDEFQEPVLSESAQVGSEFTKNMPIFSCGESYLIEKEHPDKDDLCVPIITKSASLPRLCSPTLLHVSAFHRSRSAENLIDSRKACTERDIGKQMDFEKVGDKTYIENLAYDADENYNPIASARQWIVPDSYGTDTGIDAKAPTKDYKLKRIEQWVTNLRYTGPHDETGEAAPFEDHQELLILNTSMSKPAAANYDASVMLGAEAAKTYISSLIPSATTAQLCNLGLVVIPFLGAFIALKALNLSGNAIVRITSGALPRGLHILNLSKNCIATIEGLRNLSRLRVLDLSYNRILRIGHGLSGCSSLKELYLAGNKISEVEGLHRLLKLNVLDLRFNKISTTKCLGQLAANFSCLHALSLEGNPAQKHVGDEQLKKYVLCLLPNLTYYNRRSVKVGTLKDGTDRSARLGIGSHQMDRGARQEVKNMRRGTHGGAASARGSSHRRDHQGGAAAKAGSNKQVRPAQTKVRTDTTGTSLVRHLPVVRSDLSLPKSRSDGNLRAL